MRNAVSALGVLAGAAVFALRLGKLHELADKKIQPAVVVVVKPNRAGGPSRRSYPGLFRDIGKSAVAVVVIENAARHIG